MSYYRVRVRVRIRVRARVRVSALFPEADLVVSSAQCVVEV